MSEARKPDRSHSAKEGVEEGLEEQVERTDEKHAKKTPRQTRGLGELQRDPQRAMREARRARETKKD